VLPESEWQKIFSIRYKQTDEPVLRSIEECGMASCRGGPTSINAINLLWTRNQIPYRLVGHPATARWDSQSKRVRLQRIEDWRRENPTK
jgi:hypothetical protein